MEMKIPFWPRGQTTAKMLTRKSTEKCFSFLGLNKTYHKATWDTIAHESSKDDLLDIVQAAIDLGFDDSYSED